MNSLANFFDHPLEKKISAMEIPPPEISQPEKSFGLDSVNRIAGCQCTSLWRDAYGTWRCEICFPPIFESEVRERKNFSAKNPTSEISSAKNLTDENLPSEIFIIPPDHCEFDPFEFLGEIPQPPCPQCNSLDFWWSILNVRNCQRCHPRPKRSRELLELVPKLREAAERARLAEASRLAKAAPLAKE